MVLVLSSCKSECKTSGDCASKSCSLAKCEKKKCVYAPQSNCCGNGVKESIESGKPGSQCTCPQDYGKCEGRGKIKIGTRAEDAAYAHYYCSDSKCIMGVESKDAAPQNFLDTMNTGFFKASSIMKYNKPFDMGRDVFEFKVTLDDAGKDIVLPLKLTGIKMLFSGEYARSELLVAERGLDSSLAGIGESVTVNVPLNLDYRPQEIEEAGSIRYTIDYTYTKKIQTGRSQDGTILYEQQLVREKFLAPSKQVFFVRSG